jgi:hypothetical protein
METATYDPTGLIAGDYPVASRSVTIESGQGVLARGTVLGRKSIGSASSATKSGGNTGNGTFVLDVTTPVLPGSKAGIYTLRCITIETHGGTFRLTDPEGFLLGDFKIPAGAGNSITVANDIKGVISDGGTDFAAGDGFDITVAADAGKYVKAVAAAADGSAKPVAILGDEVDVTSADRAAPAYFSGEFAAAKMSFGTGHDADSVDAAFRDAAAPMFVRKLL